MLRCIHFLFLPLPPPFSFLAAFCSKGLSTISFKNSRKKLDKTNNYNTADRESAQQHTEQFTLIGFIKINDLWLLLVSTCVDLVCTVKFKSFLISLSDKQASKYNIFFNIHSFNSKYRLLLLVSQHYYDKTKKY